MKRMLRGCWLIYSTLLDIFNRPAVDTIARQAKAVKSRDRVIARQAEQIRRATGIYAEQQARLKTCRTYTRSLEKIMGEQRKVLRRCARRRAVLSKMVNGAIDGVN